MNASPGPVRLRRWGASRPHPGVPSFLAADERWLVEGPPDMVARVVERLPHVARPVAEGLAVLEFGNQVGITEIPGLGRVEVRSGKWGREHYGRMLEEIEEIARGLPFGFETATSVMVRREDRLADPVLYHLFVLLRWHLLEADGEENLATCWEIVLADPHRVLARERRTVPPEAARAVEPVALDALLGRGPLRPAPGCRAPLCVALGEKVPEQVEEVFAREIRDTPENRFALAFLDRCRRIVGEALRRWSGSEEPRRARLARDAEEMKALLDGLRRHRAWTGVGRMRVVPSSSTVLHRRRGYRGLYRVFSRLEQATRMHLPEDLLGPLLAVRDIAQLYELWCFFQVAAAVGAVLGPPERVFATRPGPAGAELPGGTAVRWPGGIAVHYNTCFARGRPSRESWSVELCPDIALEVPGSSSAPLFHLFDAKFRQVGTPTGGGATVPADALHKMHAYRDALPGARCVVALYPGDVFRFYHPDGTVAPGPGELRAEPGGVGAVPLRPEPGGDRALRELVAGLLAGGEGGP